MYIDFLSSVQNVTIILVIWATLVLVWVTVGCSTGLCSSFSIKLVRLRNSHSRLYLYCGSLEFQFSSFPLFCSEKETYESFWLRGRHENYALGKFCLSKVHSVTWEEEEQLKDCCCSPGERWIKPEQRKVPGVETEMRKEMQESCRWRNLELDRIFGRDRGKWRCWKVIEVIKRWERGCWVCGRPGLTS